MRCLRIMPPVSPGTLSVHIRAGLWCSHVHVVPSRTRCRSFQRRWRDAADRATALPPADAEEVLEHLRALLLADPGDHLHAVVEAGVADHVPDRSGGTGLRVPRPEHDPADPGQHERARAHRARLQRDHEGAPVQPPAGERTGRLPQGEDLGVRGGVAVGLATVTPAAEYGTVRSEDDGADRHVTSGSSPAGQVQRLIHGSLDRRIGRRRTRRTGHGVIMAAGRLASMRVHVADHPLIAHKLTILRDETTRSPTFRLLVDELVTLLAYEATREVRTTTVEITTPVAPTTGTHPAAPQPTAVPLLRAALGMLAGMSRPLPTAEVGFLGMQRDEQTFEAITYAERLPDDLSGRQCYVLDPMLATGHTLIAAIEYLLARGAVDVTAICLLAAPEGLRTVEEAIGARGDVTIVTAAVDERLNEQKYIVPGLGDAG